MKFCDFKIGQDFILGDTKYRCTDIGTRVIVGMELNDIDLSWNNGPPYAIEETVFDEYDLEVCEVILPNSYNGSTSLL